MTKKDAPAAVLITIMIVIVGLVIFALFYNFNVDCAKVGGTVNYGRDLACMTDDGRIIFTQFWGDRP